MTDVAGGPNSRSGATGRAKASRGRTNINVEVQTEATFVPSLVDLKYVYEPAASEQFSQLSQLRTLIQRCMQEVAGNVYDVVSFKDVMFKLEEEFPTNLPVTDMLLLSSKLFRTTSELARLLGCFFGVVFADEHTDEHFHFTEIRILQRELREVKRQLKDATEEKVRLQQMLDNVGQVALDHGKAVELLENHNQALQLQTNALEDQMALLFRQLNSDLEVSCKDAYDKVTMELEMQERLNPARTTYRQTMDSLSQQIRSSRSLISEVREALMSCSQDGRTGDAYLAIEPSIRFKLKMLDSNFQQLVGRFTSVKDTVVETAQELMTALHERKRILYLSYQHIRLYDLQNAKLRAGKAILSELRNYTNDLLQRMQATFPSGSITSVDRIGRITTQRWHGGYTLAALRQRKAAAAAAANKGNEAGAGPGTSTVLPGLTEVEMMAAESELAAFEEQSGFGGNGSATGAPPTGTMHGAILPPSPPSMGVPPMRAGFAGEDGGELPGDVGGTGMATEVSVLASRRGTGSNLGGGAGGAPAVLFDEASKGHAAPFTNVHSLLEVARLIDGDITKLNDALTLEDEMSAFLKTLTLSVTSTARADIGSDGTLMPSGLSAAASLEKLEGDFERALMPTGGLTSYKQRNSIDSLIEREKDRLSVSDADSLTGTPTRESSSKRKKGRGGSANSNGRGDGADGAPAMSKAEQGHAEALLARQAQQLQRKQEQLSKLQDDFSSKLGFLRQVYEARITDLEMKETTLKKKFTVGGAGGASPLSTQASLGFPSRPYAEGNETAISGSLSHESTTPVGASGQVSPRQSSAQQTFGGSGRKKTKTGTGVPAKEEAEFAMVRDVNVPRGADDEMAQLRGKTDREELLAARGEWRKAKQGVLSGRKMREATATEIDRVEQKTETKKAKKRAEMTKDAH